MYFQSVLYRSAFYILIFLLGVSSCYSQDFIYKHYDVQDGLPNPTIHAIYQDKNGFLWIGTESGLCRYDGSRFKTFTVKDGLPGNEVLGIFQDSQERLWLSFYKHTVAYVYKGKIYNQENDSMLRRIQLTGRIVGIAEDNNGNICICDVGAIHVVGKDDSCKTYNPVEYGLSSAMAPYSDGTGFIMSSNEQVYRFEDGRFQLLREMNNGPQLAQPGLLLHKNYFSWVYTDTIYLRDTSIYIKINPKIVVKYSSVSDSLFSINTHDGALLFHIGDYSLKKILPGHKISNVYMDREKNIWIGTLSAGLYKVSSQAIVNKKIGDNLDNISYVTKVKNRIVVGNNSSFIYEFTGSEFKMIRPRLDTAYSVAKVIFYEEYERGQYYSGYSNWVVANILGKKITYHFSRLKQISHFDENRLLISSGNALAVVYKDNPFVWDTISAQQPISALRTGDSILMGKLTGLDVYKIEKGNYRLVDSLLPGANIVDIKKSANGYIWICTVEDGLYCISQGKIIRHFTEASGLPGDNGRALHIWGNDVWFGTDKGLAKIAQHNNDFQLQKYSTADGLASDIINAIFVDSNVIYLGTPEGLCIFDERMIETSSICNLVLTGVSIGDSAVEYADKYILRAAERFTIEFSGISLRSEQEMNFRYKIHGIDENWRSSRLNVLEFTALPYGDYELEIVAINKFGKESAPLKIKFLVERPFHKTTWFVSLMILLPALAIGVLVNRRFYVRRKKQLQKLQQEIKITKLEQMALRAQMNPHFIFNCISAIQQLVIEKDTDNASRFISSFAELVRQTLDNAPELFIPLAEEVKFLSNYFELERIRLEDRFSYHIDTSDVQNKELIRVPNMVIQPFVENAIKHGIRYKKNGRGFIEVIFRQEENILRCIITDNGVGREKALQMRKESGINYMSKGMGITLRRIDSLKALTGKKIFIDIEDIKDAGNMACGTRVNIVFHHINDYHDKDHNNR